MNQRISSQPVLSQPVTAKQTGIAEQTGIAKQTEVVQALRGALRRLESGRRRNAVRDHARRLAKREARAQTTAETFCDRLAGTLESHLAAGPMETATSGETATSVETATSMETAEVGTEENHCADTPLLEGWLCSSGWPELDAILPERGWLRGSLIEWFSAGAGSGARLLALLAAVHACRTNMRAAQHTASTQHGMSNHRPAKLGNTSAGAGVLVVLDRRRVFYPPAVLRWGLAPEQLVVLQPDDAADERWALDQVLRSSGVAAVWAEVENLDERTFRRYQLAAESSGVVGMLLRPAWCRRCPSWSELQLWVEPQPAAHATRSAHGDLPVGMSVSKSLEETSQWRWRIELMRSRGGGAGRGAMVMLDEQSGRFVRERLTPVEWERPEWKPQPEPATSAQYYGRRRSGSRDSRVTRRQFRTVQEQRELSRGGRLQGRTTLPADAAAVAAARILNPVESRDGLAPLPHALHLATQLADPKVGRRSARA